MITLVKRPKGAHRASKRVGRGPASGKGLTAGRGVKGQKARAGGKTKVGFEGGQTPIFRRLPKRGMPRLVRKTFRVQALNLRDVSAFVEKGIFDGMDLRLDQAQQKHIWVKLLGKGDVPEGLRYVLSVQLSASAREKLLAKQVKILETPTAEECKTIYEQQGRSGLSVLGASS